MRILVLGGSVFLSKATAAEAVRRGHEVVCANRGLSGDVPAGATFVGYDRDDPWPEQLQGFDAVVDVGRHPSRVRRAVEALPDAHWVFVSTVSVYADEATPGQRPGAPLVEPIVDDVDLRENPSAYGGMKVACEQVVTEKAASASIVRPGLIVGPGDPTGRFTYWPVRMARAGGPVLVPGDPEDPVQVIDVRDLASWLVDLAENRTQGVWDAISSPLGIGELLTRVAEGCDVAPVLVWVKREFLEAQGVEPWTGPRSLPLWLPRPELDGMQSHDAEPAFEAGLELRPLADTARDTLDWFNQQADAALTGLSDEQEAEALAAWLDREADAAD